MMRSSSSIASDEYVFEYNLQNDYNHYNHYKYNKSSGRSYSLGISQPTFHAYQAYPSHITITLNNKEETWVEYIRRQFTRFFGCFSTKIYSEVPDLPVDLDI